MITRQRPGKVSGRQWDLPVFGSCAFVRVLCMIRSLRLTFFLFRAILNDNDDTQPGGELLPAHTAASIGFVFGATLDDVSGEQICPAKRKSGASKE
jgi:hypothetical protein